MKKNFLLLATMLLLFACKPDVLSLNDDGKTLRTNVGKSFQLSLPENATTGYRWHFKTEPESQMVITFVSDETVRPQTKRLGAGSNRIFTYQATNSGVVKLKGFHSRPWESSENQQIPAVEYTIIVRP